MSTQKDQTLSEYLIALADDELILGQRDSEWCGFAPILEEDIAFANLALDEIGHALLWYEEAARLRQQDPQQVPDRLVYFRSAEEFRNVQLVELPRRDWAYTILRQYLFDAAETVRLPALSESQNQAVRAIAAKIQKEEIYHLRHSRSWMIRLGQGTEESRTRLQAALDELWGPAQQLLAPLPGEKELVQARIVPPSGDLHTAWRAAVLPVLQDCGLSLPEQFEPPVSRSEHTAHLKTLLAEMQSVARLEPSAQW